MKIYIAATTKELQEAFKVMVQLRPNYNEKDFIKQVQKQQDKDYKIILIKEAKKVVAVAGFRILENLAYGKFLYIDDLITDNNNRSRGYGDKLFDYLVGLAKKEKCTQLHLDSGVQRFDAHRFYLRKRMSITAHHFGINLD